MVRAKAVVGGFQPELLTDPCAFLLAEHGRHRVLLGHLVRLVRQARSPARPAIARAISAWLSRELPLHLADETESLVPRVAPLGSPIVSRIGQDDAMLHELRRELCEVLAPIAAGHMPPKAFMPAALAFAQLYRERLAAEEAEFLPLARRVLGAADCDAIAAEMRQRRS